MGNCHPVPNTSTDALLPRSESFNHYSMRRYGEISGSNKMANHLVKNLITRARAHFGDDAALRKKRNNIHDDEVAMTFSESRLTPMSRASKGFPCRNRIQLDLHDARQDILQHALEPLHTHPRRRTHSEFLWKPAA